MNRNDFMLRLAELIRPRSPLAASTQLGKMLPFLVDLPDGAFCDQSLSLLAGKLKRSPAFAEVRAALDGFCRANALGVMAPAAPPPETAMDRERRAWAEREHELRAEWDDPAGILARVRTCEGDPRLLGMLAGLVLKWAPQHLGYLPPAALDRLNQPETMPDRALEVRPPPTPRYLSPEQLQAGRGLTRHANTTAPADVTAAPASADAWPDDVWPDSDPRPDPPAA